jgi:hypothetical protein
MRSSFDRRTLPQLAEQASTSLSVVEDTPGLDRQEERSSLLAKYRKSFIECQTEMYQKFMYSVVSFSLASDPLHSVRCTPLQFWCFWFPSSDVLPSNMARQSSSQRMVKSGKPGCLPRSATVLWWNAPVKGTCPGGRDTEARFPFFPHRDRALPMITPTRDYSADSFSREPFAQARYHLKVKQVRTSIRAYVP